MPPPRWPQVPSTRASRAAVIEPLVGPGAGADTLEAGTGHDAIMTHAGGAGALGVHPATAFRVLLPTSQAACVPGGHGGALSSGSAGMPLSPQPWVLGRACGCQERDLQGGGERVAWDRALVHGGGEGPWLRARTPFRGFLIPFHVCLLSRPRVTMNRRPVPAMAVGMQ